MHQPLALRVAYFVVRDHAEAADVTQDAFIKAYRSIRRFRTDAPLRPWLMRIVRNEALNRVRADRRRRRLELRVSGDPASGEAAPSPEADAMARDEQRRLLRHIDELPPRYRDVIAYRYLLGMSERETATALGLPPGTVKSRSARALDRLRAVVVEDSP